MKKKEVHEITCLLCPMGCKAKVTIENEAAPRVESVECPRGEDYTLRELRAPMRDFFTLVRVEGAKVTVLPVRATGPIPKGKIAECASELAKIKVGSPVKMGDVIIKNILNIGVDIIATKEC